MNATSEELLEVFCECFDAALSTHLRAHFDDMEADVEALKGALSLDYTRAVLEYRVFVNAVFERRLRAMRLGVSVERFRKSIVEGARRFAETRSLEDLTFAESRGSSALTLLWRFMRWRRREESARLLQ